jgi:nicotinate dehydrogenase subunit B
LRPRIARKLIQCDTAVTPDQGTTSGGQSTPNNFNSQNLAPAAATAREALLKLAAQHLGGSIDRLAVSEGSITNTAGRRVTYAQLVGDPPSRPRPERHGRVIRPRVWPRPWRMWTRTRSFNIPGARVVVRKDLVGVVAETQYVVVQAAHQLTVRWNPGPALPQKPASSNTFNQQPSRDSLSVNSADVEKQISGAVVRARYTHPFQMHGSVGTSRAVAEVKPNQVTVWSATQSVYPPSA